LTELQLLYDEDMPDRLAAYATLARRKYKQAVYVTVVYFMPPPAGKTIVEAYHHQFMGQQAHQDFQVIKLWELEAEGILAFDNPVLLPFVPLMRGGNTEQMVRKCANRIRQEPKAAELEAILALFAGYVLDAETIKQILRWEMQVVQDSPIIQELRQEWLEQGREQGIEEGREQGREEGERKAALKALRQTLTIRFDIALGEFDERFESLGLKWLEQLNEVALTVQTLAEFKDALADMLSKLETTAPPPDDSE
jgi:predicted transposase YdaD